MKKYQANTIEDLESILTEIRADLTAEAEMLDCEWDGDLYHTVVSTFGKHDEALSSFYSDEDLIEYLTECKPGDHDVVVGTEYDEICEIQIRI